MDRDTIHLPDGRKSEQGQQEQPEDNRPAPTGAARGGPPDGEDAATPAQTAVQDGRADMDAPSDQATPLWPDEESSQLSRRWEAIQDAFVDKPREAVEKADELVASVAARMIEMFAEERAKLEGQWDRDGEASTEDLRIALLRYRAFFGRLLVI